MKEFNCPDCQMNGDSCENCPRYIDSTLSKVHREETNNDWLNNNMNKSWSSIPKCCRNCSNHPINGGSGWCNCVLPYLERGIG